LNPKNITDAHLSLQFFPGYDDSDTAIFNEFLNPDAQPEPGFVVDFLGCRIRSTSLWKEAKPLDGTLLPIPVPADFHAEAIEWIGLLKAVRSAAGQYVAMELGAGFGPWSVAGGVAAMRRGIEKIRLYAIEGDSQHFQSLRQHFTDNGFEPGQHALFEAAVGVRAGTAHWPIIDDSLATEQWGCRPLESPHANTDTPSQNTRPVQLISMRDLVTREPLWDLIHIDIQGDEVDICRSCIDELSARVRRIVVGTHSRKIDGDLLELLSRAGWALEHEKPAKFTFLPYPSTLEAMTTLDGTQVWRNPALMHAGDPLTSFSQEITSSVRDFRVHAGSSYTIQINVKNTGTQSWFRGVQAACVAASYRWLDRDGNVLPIEGKRTLLSRPTVRPGESDVLSLELLAPPHPGEYTLWISMVQEGVDWFYRRGAKPLVLRARIE
jgi:FkbM family methyltransferase